jgi:hypothetical protein
MKGCFRVSAWGRPLKTRARSDGSPPVIRCKIEANRPYAPNSALVGGHAPGIRESGIPPGSTTKYRWGEVGRLEFAVPMVAVGMHALTCQRNAFRCGFQSWEAISHLALIQGAYQQFGAIPGGPSAIMGNSRLFLGFFFHSAQFLFDTCKKRPWSIVVYTEVKMQWMRRTSPILAVFLSVCFSAVAQQDGHPAQATNSAAVESRDAASISEATPASERPDLTPDAQGKLSQEQMQKLLRVVADKDIENDKRQRDYTYIERQVENKLDGEGNKKSTEIKTYEILEIYGEQVERLIAKDDKPLDAKDAAKEEAKIQKIMDKRKNESEDARRKREEKEAKDREDGRKFVHEIADAYNFKLLGTELVGGREAWVIEGEPRPGFEPHMKDAKYLSKFHGRVWIDKDDLQLAKMDIETLDTIAFGLVLARLHKGTRVTMEQTRVNDEVWLPKQVTFKLSARVALLKGYNMDGEQTYRDYKKFRTSSKIVSIGEVQNPK